MQSDAPPGLHGKLAAMFFIHAMALAAWIVPLTTVLAANDLGAWTPYAYATSAVAAFVSPLFFGAMADHRVAPIVVMRGLSFATGVTMLLSTWAIHAGWHGSVVLVLIQLQALCSSPTWSLSTTIVMARLKEPHRQFGPIRSMGTLGWMVGCWIISALHADASAWAGVVSAVFWFGLAAFTLGIPAITPVKPAVKLTVAQRMGLDAITLLRHPDHRGVFITAALLSVSLAAFYPYTPPHLRDLGMESTSAWMTLGQVTEMVAMFALAGMLTGWRLKWVFAAGLVFSVLRFWFCALDGSAWVLSGVALHGLSYTLFFITAQIYLEQRVDQAWRGRAQALLALMTSGVGALVGVLGSGWWLSANRTEGHADWPRFWGGLTILTAGVLVYFLMTYRGRGRGVPMEEQPPASAT